MADTNNSDSLARKILGAGGEQAPVAHALKLALKPAIFTLGVLVDYVAPLYVSAFNIGFEIYKKLPVDILTALMGLGLSFCGGAYCASIAAMEAFRMSGWETTKAALHSIAVDIKAIYAAERADRMRDDDGDGVPDVQQISPQDLMTRKLSLWAMAVKDPEKLSIAIGGLYGSWLAVQGVLRLEFAKTITLGVSVAEMATPTLQRLGVPLLKNMLPKAYHHWIPVMIKTGARMLGVALAWRIQTVVSAFHLALRGGLLCARAMLRWANGRGLLQLDEEKTYADEVVGYGIAACGFYCQLNAGFSVPFPLSILMLPFTCVEWYIRYTITASAPIA